MPDPIPTSVAPLTVPTVDLRGWTEGSAADRQFISEQIDAMGRSVGFLSITGHGIDASASDGMLEVTGAFFDLDADIKVAYTPTDKAVNRGYAGYGAESLAYSLGIESPPDMFEAFNIGAELSMIDGASDNPYFQAERTRFFAPNVWPDELPEMRAIWLEYWDQCNTLADRLDRVCSIALGMPENFIRMHTSKAPNVMRANNYQRRSGHDPAKPGQMRMGAHTDYGVFTILLADPLPGLQILGPDGAWVDVLPAAGALLVNIGDLLAEWTNDRWRSTLHRVVPPPVDVEGPFRRRSVAFFHEANYDAVIEAMPTCVGPGDTPRYSPVTAGEHLLAKLMGPRTGQASTAQQTSTIYSASNISTDIS